MRQIGNYYEDLALSHLKKAGLTLLARNYTCRYGELDLIMSENATIVFVEVRYRRNPNFGDGVDSITTSKRAKLIRTATSFLQANPSLAQRACRFDVVALAGMADKPSLDWLRNAFEIV